VYSLRYHCALYTGVCYRVGLAQWRIEEGARIPTHDNGRPRTTADIMVDVNRAFELAVRRDPANWFWVHNRWKAGLTLRPPPDIKPADATPVTTVGAGETN
jgi:KDO2-lipid IV(A) lauroyltransferase